MIEEVPLEVDQMKKFKIVISQDVLDQLHQIVTLASIMGGSDDAHVQLAAAVVMADIDGKAMSMKTPIIVAVRWDDDSS